LHFAIFILHFALSDKNVPAYNPPTMSSRLPSIRSHITLSLCILLHAFTHAYQSALVPLYLIMRDDLHRQGVKAIALIPTIYLLVYSLLAYPSGMLADHFNRKALLGIGLIGNALAIALMGTTRQYEMLLVLGVMAGLFGTLFHPTANALVPAHYPASPGMAIGLLGMGSGLGFFIGPQFSGWRADAFNGGWWHGMAAWQVPCFELGLAGLLMGIIFLFAAREVHHEAHAHKKGQPLGKEMRRRVLAIAAILGCRDFAGVATGSLISIYLQKAHGYDTRQAGWVVGAMMLVSITASPLAVWFSPRHWRLRAMILLLVTGGILLTIVPHISLRWTLPMLCVFQIFHLGSYAVSEAAMLERVSPAVRGRVIGLFLTLAGTFAATSPWIMGFWTDLLKERAFRPSGYYPVFGILGALMAFAALSARLIAGLSHGAEPRVLESEDVIAAAMEPMV
jgi:MFS family permease